MSHAETIETTADAVVVVTAPIRHLCPVRDEIDNGSITVEWQTRGKTYELHSLAEYFASWAHTALSHEDLTDRIAHDLAVVPLIDLLSVQTAWNTAGMEVRCAVLR